MQNYFSSWPKYCEKQYWAFFKKGIHFFSCNLKVKKMESVLHAKYDNIPELSH